MLLKPDILDVRVGDVENSLVLAFGFWRLNCVSGALRQMSIANGRATGSGYLETRDFDSG